MIDFFLKLVLSIHSLWIWVGEKRKNYVGQVCVLTNYEPCPCWSGYSRKDWGLQGRHDQDIGASVDDNTNSSHLLRKAFHPYYERCAHFRGKSMEPWCWDAVLDLLGFSHFALQIPNAVTYSRSQNFATLMNISMSTNIFELELRLQTGTQPSTLGTWCWYWIFFSSTEEIPVNTVS